jgi:hypothetical protein
MKLYRLYNLTEQAPAAGLHFLKREDAERYKEVIRWPYEAGGRWPTATGREIPLEQLDLRVEVVELPVHIDRVLELALALHEGRLGSAPLLAGDCFDPRGWEACTPEDLAHPLRGPLLENARILLQRED